MLIYKFEKIFFLTTCCALFCGLCTTISVSDVKKNSNSKKCDQIPLRILKKLHGPAFDARYMSVTKPLESDENALGEMDNVDRKRSAEVRPSFYITEDHTEVLSEEPAWNIQWDTFEAKVKSRRRKRSLLPIGVDSKQDKTESSEILMNRQKRQNRVRSEPWQCERNVKWVQLGPDYHPPHIRTVECTQPKCYYQMYDCKPRHFSVRILQRRRGMCADASSLKVYGFNNQLAEVWEWVEVAVNFCCDCVAPKKYF